MAKEVPIIRTINANPRNEYFGAMREAVLEGAGELMEKYKRAAAEAFEKLLPDTERLPERREEWDDFYEPDDGPSLPRSNPVSVPLWLTTAQSLAATALYHGINLMTPGAVSNIDRPRNHPGYADCGHSYGRRFMNHPFCCRICTHPETIPRCQPSACFHPNLK